MQKRFFVFLLGRKNGCFIVRALLKMQLLSILRIMAINFSVEMAYQLGLIIVMPVVVGI